MWSSGCWDHVCFSEVSALNVYHTFAKILLILVKLIFKKQDNQIQKLELELEHVTQERQSLRLAQSQLREALEESRDQVGVCCGPNPGGVSLASDGLSGTSPARGILGLPQVARLVGHPPGPGLSQAQSRVGLNSSEPREELRLFLTRGRGHSSASRCALYRWRGQGTGQVASEVQANTAEQPPR